MKHLGKYFLLAFLLVFAVLPSVDANGWGDPLATDPSGDGSNFGEDILAVYAQYANGFISFRFQLNEPLMTTLDYGVYIGYDSNLTNGYSTEFFSEFDSGPDLLLLCNPATVYPDSYLTVSLSIFGSSWSWVKYNVTANNDTAMAWSDLSVVPYFVLHTFENGSQAEFSFGVNWNWITSQMAGLIWDEPTLYLEFRSGQAGTDWCPDRTLDPNDYIEWDLPTSGIPGFTTPLAFLSILTLLAVIILLERKPPHLSFFVN